MIKTIFLSLVILGFSACVKNANLTQSLKPIGGISKAKNLGIEGLKALKYGLKKQGLSLKDFELKSYKTQLVSGMNYIFILQNKKLAKKILAFKVYKNLQGKYKIFDIKK